MMNSDNNHSPKQLVILSGKGGTGKTSISASFAYLARQSDFPVAAVLADADVDAANLELLLQPEIQANHDFIGTLLACIETEKCSHCGKCIQHCRFDAISMQVDDYQINHFACDGCAACFYVCPSGAISMRQEISGNWYLSNTPFGKLIHARLIPGQENSGKLVTLVKQQARLLAKKEEKALLIIDGPPGIGCPVISAASGADLALIITEPGKSGVHDMKRVLEVAEHFKIEKAVVINKSDIYPQGTQEIMEYCKNLGVPVLGQIPFDRKITEAIVEGKIVVDRYPMSPSTIAISEIWQNLIENYLFSVKDI